MHGLALVADDDVLHETPDDVVEDGDAEEGEAVGPGDEDRSEHHERDTGRAVEVFLEVEFFVTARGAGVDRRFGRRSDDVGRSAAEITRARRLAGIAPKSRFAVVAEKVDGAHFARSR